MGSRFGIACILLTASAGGCQRAEAPRYVSSKAVLELPDELQEKIVGELTKYCGTPANPKLLGDDTVSPQRLQQGAHIFRQRCEACHGVAGDGAGPAAEYMNPSPRDFRPGVFKFTSTAYGQEPLRDDLVRFVRNGGKGTAMPSFKLLPDDDLQAVIDYVLVLTHRGELERLLAAVADDEGEINPDATPELIENIMSQWAEARDGVVTPISKPIPYSLESAAKGREAFFTETAGCVKCHGDDGRGRDIPNYIIPGTDEPVTVRSADLTAGMFHGGDRSEDIYRRIYAGINGTPMPGFGQSFASQPETLWQLVHYVQYISSARRRDVMEHMPTLKRNRVDASEDAVKKPQANSNSFKKSSETKGQNSL